METIRMIYIAIIVATVIGMLAYFYVKYDKGNKNFKPLCFSLSAIAAIPIAVLALG